MMSIHSSSFWLMRHKFLISSADPLGYLQSQVIFPALDSRVKNIAQTYSLEHKEECDLFDQMLLLLTTALNDSINASAKLRRDIICCTEVIQTTLCKHMSKEEEQVACW